MLTQFVRNIAGPVVRSAVLWSTTNGSDLPIPVDEPRVHAMGPNPDRVLVVGAGAVRGVGVISHELGLGGHLARRLSALTGRGADIEMLGVAGLSASGAARIVADRDLSRMDALVLMLGAKEALGLNSIPQWSRTIRALLESMSGSLPVFVVGVAPLPSIMPMAGMLRQMVDRQVMRLNAETALAAEATGAHYIPFDPTHEGDYAAFGGTSTYVAWAEPIATHMFGILDSLAATNRHSLTDEEYRQFSLDSLGILETDPDPEIDAVVRVARDLFGVMGAMVNFIDRDRQWMKSASGLERGDIPRRESFCALTIELEEQLVIEDTRLDPRVRDLPAVGLGILFYAGYPIEAPNGECVGTLCLVDSKPRAFTKSDASLLRELALRVQAIVWMQAKAIDRAAHPV